MNVEEREMYDFAKLLMYSAGSKLKQERRQSVIKVKEKTSQMDLVTEHDLLIEKYLIDAILSNYPDHNILAEESREQICSKHNDDYAWVIDPIDGTVNYYRFGKDYAISLALYKNENPIFGLVYDVANSEMFSAGHGEGAIINGLPLDALPDSHDKLSKAVVGISLRTMREFASLGMDVMGMLSQAQAYRYLGCASLEICKVANGEYDLFISSNVHQWDIAAARIFLEQRGGEVLIRRNNEDRSPFGKLLVAAFRSPLIWTEAREYLPLCLRDKFDA
ncbi:MULTISPECIES: inositol monophosphatase family protein [Desulfosporosinus]|uniref:Inositol-1-monophosphatase n=1 Tax=Desulfosporosinus acididurans TaxID=476652 RepID=A0A0J1FT37_9FIRM|nr:MULTISPECIES: inositol monophosphatase family protein [Desulfosporosinus]KLU66629.1 inositol-1-monophosphatase [Desulfosporosinus acididurans]